MSHAQGRLSARPRAGALHEPGGTGERGLELGRRRRDGLLYVPMKYHPARPAPVVVLLHGAGGDARGTLPILRAEADLRGIILLAPESEASTWDMIASRYGPDVAFIDRALDTLFERYAIDAERIAVAGFSDGASYALSLGLANGDLFRDVLAFSPGYAAPAQAVGRPRIFISHGDEDRVLPIERCGRPLSQRLTRAGYDVDYREFHGGHVVPPDLVREGVKRFLA